MARWKIAASLSFVLVVVLAWMTFASRTPLRVMVETTDARAIISVDGQHHQVDWSFRTTHLRFLHAPALEREYQIDGSDSTSQGTLNLDYFRAISTTLYYRFQSWLRDEPSYSRWSNIVVRDRASGASIIHTSAPTEAEHVALPASFVVSADLERPEKWAAILFLDEQDNGYLLHINRDGRALEFSRWQGGGPSQMLQRWYFPEDPRPFAAMLVDTLAHVLFWATALVVGAIICGALWSVMVPWPMLPGRLSSHSTKVIACAILLVSFAVVTYITVVKYNGLPHIFDSLSLFFQARILASGRLSIPTPPHQGLFDYPFMVSHEGRYFSQYPPGVPATISMFLRISPDVGWLAGPFVSVATLAGIYTIARIMYDRQIALLALLLAALSPFYNFMAGSLMSHPFSLFYLTFFLLFLVHYRQMLARCNSREPAGAWGKLSLMAAGAFLGAALISRESAAVFFAAPWLTVIFGEALWRRRQQAVADLGIFAYGFLLVASLYLLYNACLTGSPFRTPRSLFDPRDRWGFGDVGFFGRHTPAAGLVVADAQVTMLLIHLFGWPFYLTLAPALIPLITAQYKGWDVVNALTILSFIVGFAGYYYHGNVYGPRYYYEALPSLVILTARGFQVAGETAAGLWQHAWGEKGRRTAVGSYLVMMALIACNLLYYMPRQMHLYEGYAGGAKKPDLRTIYSTRLSNAVIMTDDLFLYRDVLAPLNCPDLATCDPIYVLVRSEDDLKAARRLYPDRTLYRLREQDRRAVFEVVLVQEGTTD